jgi:hypothetical protein
MCQRSFTITLGQTCGPALLVFLDERQQFLFVTPPVGRCL